MGTRHQDISLKAKCVIPLVAGIVKGAQKLRGFRPLGSMADVSFHDNLPRSSDLQTFPEPQHQHDLKSTS